MFRLEIYKRVEASEEEAAAAFEGDCENAQNPIIHFYAERIFLSALKRRFFESERKVWVTKTRLS